ncbi:MULTISPECIES: ABC transporter ATP-binding protein [Rhodococcus]|uniref:ABC transporter ATP-binding protein n=1 Tax=Rhodococcus cercidiphylli TaxID=489916 RepID=A0ABU4B0T0_9NOCA|nr:MULTISPECIES: ABC transporter ATP-binding protein [Rhodococcus]MDV6232112.1 ABC transporter ATP-binding protein [Rhodococcus cercidiphylli]MDV7990241.1 ABC transporter ATP-binding protein [Rhodococcus sp. IEGM 1374]
MSTITIERLGLRYHDGTVGVEGIDLEIADGEFVALVGPSGSGKTTLLRTVAGFLTPTAGSISIGPDVVASEQLSTPPESRKLGMVFQQHALWPHRSVGRNVSYPLELAKVSKPERTKKVADVLELVGLPGLENRDPSTLSGGQRQRVALARALVGSPRALLLDEALSALDEPLRDRLRLELRSLTRAAGLTVVHVTHDRTEALALADRVVVLDRSSIAQIGTPEDVVRAPNSAFVARFLSDATLVDGTVAHGTFTSGSLTLAADGSGPGTVAILPTDIELVTDGERESTIEGTVTSSLFGRDASDVLVRSGDVDFRCSVRGPRPEAGDTVALEVRRSFFYPR